MRSAEIVRKKRPSPNRAADNEPERTSGRQRQTLGAHYGAGPAGSLQGVEGVRDDSVEETSGGRIGGTAETDADRSEPAVEAAPDGNGPADRKLRVAGTEAPAAGGGAGAAPARAVAPEDAEKVPEPAGASAREAGGGASVELPAAARARETPDDARFRLPGFAELESVYKSTTLKIPEDVIKDRVGQLLRRMEKEGRLKVADPVPTILANLFPGPGMIDVKEFERVVTPGDLEFVYGSVKDADTAVKAPDKPRLEKAIKDSADLADAAAADADNLTRVFGGEDGAAKKIYAKTAKALRKIVPKMDRKITTDYNRDDDEAVLGGWASFREQKMHLDLATVKVTDANEAKFTILHEGAHLASGSVDDHIYYADPKEAFKATAEKTKIKNAAHFEEIPRRQHGGSVYGDTEVFTPGVTSTGAALTFEQEVVEEVIDYLRMAWDKAVDVFALLRQVRKDLLDGKTSSYHNHRGTIRTISKLFGLTIHHQKRPHRTVTQLDVVLAESVARRLSLLQDEAASVTVPAPPASMTSREKKQLIKKLGKELAREVVKAHGGLLDTDKENSALLSWLVFNYRKGL